MSNLYGRTAIAAAILALTVTLPASAAGENAAEKNEKVKLEIEKPKDAYGNSVNCLLAPAEIMLRLEKRGEPPPVMVPAGTKLLSRGTPVTSSDKNILIGTLDLVTNGDKEALQWKRVELGPGVQWVQIDLGKTAQIAAVAL